MKSRAELRDLIWRLTSRLVEEIPARFADRETIDLVKEGFYEGRHSDAPEVAEVHLVHDEPDGIQ